MHTTRGVWALGVAFLAAAAGACKKKSVPDAALDDRVVVRVDDVEVARVRLGPEEGPRDVATLLPGEAANEEDWVLVGAQGEGGRTFAVRRPRLRYPGSVTRLYRDDDGRLSLGIFRVPTPGMSAAARKVLEEPLVGLRNIDVVDVRLTERVIDAATVRKDAFVIDVVGKGAVEVEPQRLESLPRTTDPRGRAQGWALGDVLRLYAGGRTLASVELVLENDETMTLRPEDLSDPKQLLLVKHNKRGALRVQRYEIDPSEEPGERRGGQSRPREVVKDVVRIRVTLEKR